MKYGAPKSNLLYLWCLLCVLSCESSGFLVHTEVPDIPPPQQLTIHKQELASFHFIQTIIPPTDQRSKQIINQLQITNNDNQAINKLTYKIDIFKSNSWTFDNQVLSFFNKYQNPLPPQQFSDTITWNTTWEGLLVEENINLSIIHVDSRANSPFSGVYEGEYLYQIQSDSLAPGYAYGHIDRIGKVDLLLIDQSPVSRLQGQVSSEGVFLGQALDSNGSTLDDSVFQVDSIFEGSGEEIRFSLSLNGISGLPASSRFSFNLKKQ